MLAVGSRHVENIIAPYFKEKQSVYVENKCVFF